MTMSKALQNLYKAITGESNSKVNISKLLVDIHYAITGEEAAVKNNRTKIINSMATNWPSGGKVVEVEELSVTDNDTYIAPTGKAYSPVTVNVSGGSGDLSTAQVTCINSSSESEIPFIMAHEDDEWAEGSFTQVFVEQEATVTAILYRGKCAAIINASWASVVISGTGDVTISGFNAYITGDCTITVSDPA